MVEKARGREGRREKAATAVAEGSEGTADGRVAALERKRERRGQTTAAAFECQSESDSSSRPEQSGCIRIALHTALPLRTLDPPPSVPPSYLMSFRCYCCESESVTIGAVAAALIPGSERADGQSHCSRS